MRQKPLLLNPTDETNKWVKSAMDGIRQPVLITASASTLLVLGLDVLSAAKKVEPEEKRKLRLALGIGRASE